VKVIHGLRSALFWDVTQSREVKEFLTLADRTDCHKTAVRNYHSMLHTIPEEHISSTSQRKLEFMHDTLYVLGETLLSSSCVISV